MHELLRTHSFHRQHLINRLLVTGMPSLLGLELMAAMGCSDRQTVGRSEPSGALTEDAVLL